MRDGRCCGRGAADAAAEAAAEGAAEAAADGTAGVGAPGADVGLRGLRARREQCTGPGRREPEQDEPPHRLSAGHQAVDPVLGDLLGQVVAQRHRPEIRREFGSRFLGQPETATGSDFVSCITMHPRARRPSPAHLALALVVALGSIVAAPSDVDAAPYRLNLYRNGDFVQQTNLVQCVGASMQMMINMIASKNNRTAGAAARAPGARPQLQQQARPASARPARRIGARLGGRPQRGRASGRTRWSATPRSTTRCGRRRAPSERRSGPSVCSCGAADMRG